jgi:protein involved in polysaccharide export with SLBB domain
MLIQPTTMLSATAGAFALVFLTLGASARPMKECSARYHAAAKASQNPRCRANAPNVCARPPPRITLGIGDVVSDTIFEAEPGGLFIPSE